MRTVAAQKTAANNFLWATMRQRERMLRERWGFVLTLIGGAGIMASFGFDSFLSLIPSLAVWGAGTYLLGVPRK